MKRHVLAALLAVFLISGCGGDDLYYEDPYYGYIAELFAADDQYSTFRNQVLVVGAGNGVLANDVVCGCDSFEIRFPTETASGGSVVGNSDGSFTYTPPPNFIGTDFFDYVLEDDYGTSVGNVIIAVNDPPEVVALVDNAGGSDVTGSPTAGTPFATVQAAVQAAGNNGTVVVTMGNGSPYTGTVNLLPGQTLVGQGFEQVLAQTMERPLLSGPINMADGCTVRGLTVTGRIDGSEAENGEVSQCDLLNVPGYAIDLDGSTGSWIVEDNIIENSGGGLSVTLRSNEELRLTAQFNTVWDNTQSAFRLYASGSSELVVGLFNNAMADNREDLTVDIVANDTASVCLDAEENQSDGTYRLTRNGGLFQVEQLSRFTSLNSGTVVEAGAPIEEVADGFCGF